MGNRIFVFVVLATVMQNSLAMQTKSSARMQTALMTDYSIIDTLKKVAQLEYQKTIDDLFNLAKDLANGVCGNQNPSEDITLTINTTKTKAAAAMTTQASVTLLAIQTIYPEAYLTFSSTQEQARITIMKFADNIFGAINLTQTKNSSGTLAKIEALNNEALAAVPSYNAIIYDAFRCGNGNSVKMEEAISSAQKTANVKFRILISSIYSAIKAVLIAITSGNQAECESVLSTIENSRNQASRALYIEAETLLLTDPPTFNVTNLQINETTTQVAIWGDCGIAVIELPKRWGKDSAFQGGKEVISCRSHSLDERLFHCSGVTEVRRARWHPASTKDCHLLVLTSENTFHLYECELNGQQSLVKTWSVGPGSSSPSKIPTPYSFGEAAVDFDFVTPTVKPDIDIKDTEFDKIDWTDIEWPILVLMGNGDVCAVHGDIFTSKSKKLSITGPLSIYPRTDDNYGVDSCSIMCLQTTPPLVVIATNNGKVYHSILLREDFEDDDKKTWSQYGSTFSLHTPEDALFVFECVEMELGLCISEDDKKYSCPVHLHVDRGNNSRYFCSHNAGIHLVNLPMVSQLEEYIQRKDEDADFFLPALSEQSSSQYLVCTRTKSTQEPAPILGLGLLQDPCILIALLHTGIAISLSVVDLHYLVKIQLLEPTISPNKKMAKERFDVYIKNLLKHDVSQPILKLPPNVESSPQDVVELLLRATLVFRSEHFARQDKVQAEIAKRTRTLRALKTHQLKELESLAETRKELQEAAERLAERYEDIKDKQEEFVRRTKEVLRLIKQREPSMSESEKEEAYELKKMDNERKKLSQQLENVKNKIKYQSEHLTAWDRKEAKKDVVISKSQEDTIKSNLKQMTEEISDLMSTMNSLQEEVFS